MGEGGRHRTTKKYQQLYLTPTVNEHQLVLVTPSVLQLCFRQNHLVSLDCILSVSLSAPLFPLVPLFLSSRFKSFLNIHEGVICIPGSWKRPTHKGDSHQPRDSASVCAFLGCAFVWGRGKLTGKHRLAEEWNEERVEGRQNAIFAVLLTKLLKYIRKSKSQKSSITVHFLSLLVCCWCANGSPYTSTSLIIPTCSFNSVSIQNPLPVSVFKLLALHFLPFVCVSQLCLSLGLVMPAWVRLICKCLDVPFVLLIFFFFFYFLL